MAKLGDLSYNESEYDKSRKTTGMSKLDPGDYNVEIVEVETKTWDDGAVTLSLHAKVMDGDKEGQLHYHRFNVVNKNEKAQGIARAQLNRVCDLVGVPWPLVESDDLVGKMYRLELTYNSKGYPVEGTEAYDQTVPSVISGETAPSGKPGGAGNGSAATQSADAGAWP